MLMLRAAFGFFTRLPVGSRPLPPTFRGVIVWLPAVGLAIGTLAALAVCLAACILPPALCGVAGCLVWIAVTGGLHLDGVADCGDGLLVETPPARRLEIMKDSRLGTFGGIALFAVLATKAAALATLAAAFTDNGWAACPPILSACIMAAVLARCAVFIAMRLPSARPGGLGAALRDGLSPRHERIALGCGLAVCILNGVHGLLALVAAALAAWLLLSAARKRLGGVTGDVFGCLIELTECTALAVCCLR